MEGPTRFELTLSDSSACAGYPSLSPAATSGRQRPSGRPGRHLPRVRGRLRQPYRPDLAPAPLLVIAFVVVSILLLLAGRYGFHRDELYFVVAGQRPDWGYLDQSPLTPRLSATAVELLGLSPFAVRILPAFPPAWYCCSPEP